MIRGVYIDDDSGQQALYAELLSSDEFDFSTVVEPISISHLVSGVLESNAQIVVMDYRLDGTRVQGWQNHFKAGGLAQVLRESFVDNPERDLPIILLSTEQNIQHLFAPDRTSHDLFDLWYLKEELHAGGQSRRDEVLRKMASLVSGYRAIKEAIGSVATADFTRTLLGLGLEEHSEINTEGLRLLLTTADGATERPHVVARQIYHNVIKRPGILLGRHGLAARLGIQVSSLEAFLEAAGGDQFRYYGTFGEGWQRFWRHRFDRWESSNFDPLLTSLSGEERVLRLNEALGVDFAAASSKWTGESDEHFSFACTVCNHPTELRHSVAVFEPKLLPFQERRRVCYDCVEREEEMRRKRIQVAEADEEIVMAIRDGTIKRPGAANQ